MCFTINFSNIKNKQNKTSTQRENEKKHRIVFCYKTIKMKALKAIGLVYFIVCLWFISVAQVKAVTPVRPGSIVSNGGAGGGSPSSRLPRTSASQLSQLNNSTGYKTQNGKNLTQNGRNLRTR